MVAYSEIGRLESMMNNREKLEEGHYHEIVIWIIIDNKSIQVQQFLQRVKK